ncbi:MAG: VWA domain-containing protein [Pseudomonadota bacterium]
MKLSGAAGWALALALSCQASAAGQDGETARCADDTMLVFDASGSMAAMGYNAISSPRIFHAREALRRTLPQVAPFRNLGLVIYGPGRRDTCGNIDLKFQPRPNAAADIINAIEQVQPDGGTPLTRAVRDAAEVLRYKQRPATIVLVTDGRETCGGAPCQLAQELAGLPQKITVHIIGFKVRERFFRWRTGNIYKPEGAVTVASCLPEATGGKYVSTETLEELVAALQKTLGCPIMSLRTGPSQATDFSRITN